MSRRNIATTAQREQRELAWLLYITMGSQANTARPLYHSYFLGNKIIAQVHKINREQDKLVQMVLDRLSNIPPSK